MTTVQSARPIDFAARQRETERDPRVAELLTLRSRWIERIVLDNGPDRITDAQPRIAVAYVQRHLNRTPGHERFGMLWASAATFAREMNVGKRTVNGAFERFKALGYFEVVELGGGR